ncbi:hypothetical protein [Nostoc sp.]
MLKNIPLGRLGQPQDVASLVAFLAAAPRYGLEIIPLPTTASSQV